MMKTMVPPQVGMRLWTLQKEKKKKKVKGQKKEKKRWLKKRKKEKREEKRTREKERRDNATILLPHLCFKVAP